LLEKKYADGVAIERLHPLFLCQGKILQQERDYSFTAELINSI
jgi:hypothetical protein